MTTKLLEIRTQKMKFATRKNFFYRIPFRNGKAVLDRLPLWRENLIKDDKTAKAIPQNDFDDSSEAVAFV